MVIAPECPFLGILRGIKSHHLKPISEIVQRSGLTALEITMNTNDAPALIQELKNISGGAFKVGAGTVLDTVSLQKALNSGAEFIVSPIVDDAIILECVKNSIPVFPGALTPTEIHRAWELGAEMVKVFPADRFGPDYFKEIKGPLDKIKLLGVGGITAENAKAYLTSGADGLAFGGSIFKREWLARGNFEAIEIALQKLVNLS